MPRKPKAPTYSVDTPFADLPTLALERLANTLSKHGELMYLRLFGRHLSECRVLAIVGSREPTSLSEVCEQLDLDKGHASRLVSKLVSAGLLERHTDSTDQRSAYLLLTGAGRDVAARIHSAAAERNSEWVGGLGKDDSAAFMAAMGKMTSRAREMLNEEVARSGRETPVLKNARETGATIAKASKSLVIERVVLEDLRGQLDRLLGKEIDMQR